MDCPPGTKGRAVAFLWNGSRVRKCSSDRSSCGGQQVVYQVYSQLLHIERKKSLPAVGNSAAIRCVLVSFNPVNKNALHAFTQLALRLVSLPKKGIDSRTVELHVSRQSPARWTGGCPPGADRSVDPSNSSHSVRVHRWESESSSEWGDWYVPWHCR